MRKYLRTSASRVSDHARGGGDGGSGAQHGRTGIGRRAGQDPRDALGVLVVLGAGDGPAGGDVGGVESQHVGGRQVQADVDKFDTTAITEGVNGFQAAERHGQGGVHVRAVGGAGLHVDAAGNVDCHDGHARLVDGGEHLGRVGPQRAGTGDADHPVDHQIGCRGHAFHDSPAGAGEGGQRSLVRAFRVEEHRCGGDAPTAQERRCPQRVAAVVAGADDGTDPAPGDAAGQENQFADDRSGQPERGPPHEPAFGQRRQQRRFGFADLIGGVIVPHQLPSRSTCPRANTLRGFAVLSSEIRAGRHDGESS